MNTTTYKVDLTYTGWEQWIRTNDSLPIAKLNKTIIISESENSPHRFFSSKSHCYQKKIRHDS